MQLHACVSTAPHSGAHMFLHIIFHHVQKVNHFIQGQLNQVGTFLPSSVALLPTLPTLAANSLIKASSMVASWSATSELEKMSNELAATGLLTVSGRLRGKSLGKKRSTLATSEGSQTFNRTSSGN